MSEDRIRLLHEREARRALADRSDIDVFRYRLNKSVVVLATVVALVFFGLAVVLVRNEGLASWKWIATFVWLLSGGVTAVGLCGYWYAFAQSKLVAAAPEALYVGREQRLWGVDWDLIDADSLGLNDMDVGSNRSELSLSVAGQTIRLRLYNAFVRLEDLQGLMFELLRRVDEEEWEGVAQRSELSSENEAGP